ncbi:hypothetical protein [Micromonospora sp. RL09-050-HVF-A]|uniref:hypothetical protein n=1 Tax=unclassified Micromonospora TaxID=2617518 RepID=UPI001C5D91CD|nr:hypothetical protein [Micromonospora sp. RL09-050-HVF-A]MBW4700413.1 hypothetical protein [Micromonospora sp. RL09-050-HVF-A]
MTTFLQKRDRMRRIFRGEDTFGEGTAAEQATRFRLAEMYPEVIEIARRNSRDVDCPQVDLLVSLAGFSPETTVLAFELLRPARLLVISSDNSRSKVNVISEMLSGRITFSDFQHQYVDPVDVSEIYDIVKKAVFPRPGARPISAIIDITGGKKVMSAGAALAAAQLDLRMCYIDSEFDPEMRQAVPGTERLCVLQNPTVIFGDKGMDAAREMFRSGVYAGAAARFGELSLSMSEPAQARFLCDLSALYQAWCDLDTPALPDLVARVRTRLVDQRSGLKPEVGQRLLQQLDFVHRLVERDRSALLLNYFLLGEHYQQFHRYDFAALLYYRTIEESLSERMRRAYGGFEGGHPDYRLLDADVDGLTARYQAASRELFGGRRGTAALPWKVGLIDALLLLHCVDDALLPAAKVADLGGVGHIRSLVEVRNRSVLAHGDMSVTVDQSRILRARALQNLRAFWALHHPEERIDQSIGILRFLDEA